MDIFDTREKGQAMTNIRRLLFIALIAACLLFSTACLLSSRVNVKDKPVIETFEVQAIDGWTDTGIHIAPGNRVVITYISGTWSPWQGGSYDAIGFGGDPNCDCNIIAGVSHAALIGRVGQGQIFIVGRSFDTRMGESGNLFLGINDSRLADNSESIKVLVEVETE